MTSRQEAIHDQGAAEWESYNDFERRMVGTLGATVGGSALTKALGYPTQEAFRKAFQRGRLPVVTFELEGRRGRFAITAEIAGWLWAQRKRGTAAAISTGGDA